MVLGAKQGNAGDDDDGGANTPERALVRLLAVVVWCVIFFSVGFVSIVRCDILFRSFRYGTFSIALPSSFPLASGHRQFVHRLTLPRTKALFAAIKKYLPNLAPDLNPTTSPHDNRVVINVRARFECQIRPNIAKTTEKIVPRQKSDKLGF